MLISRRIPFLSVGFVQVMKAPFSMSTVGYGRSNLDLTVPSRKVDVWKIRRQKFMNNILGLVKAGKVRCILLERGVTWYYSIF